MPANLMLDNIIANSWRTQRFEKDTDDWPKKQGILTN